MPGLSNPSLRYLPLSPLVFFFFVFSHVISWRDLAPADHHDNTEREVGVQLQRSEIRDLL